MAPGHKDTVYTGGRVPLWAHRLLGFLETLDGLQVHHLQVDLCERQCHLVVLEVPATLYGLGNQDSRGIPEARLRSSLGVLAPLFFL